MPYRSSKYSSIINLYRVEWKDSVSAEGIGQGMWIKEEETQLQVDVAREAQPSSQLHGVEARRRDVGAVGQEARQGGEESQD